jgi:hypothetical protein
VHGLLLALSVAGGRAGERQLPLLITDADWDALTDRIYLITPALDTPELSALMNGIDQAIRRPERRAGQEALALARALLERLARTWNQAKHPVPLPALGAWFALAGRLPPEPPPPAPPDLAHTWAELFPAAPPDLADRESAERFGDWLTLAGLVRQFQPGDLQRLRFYDAVETIDWFLTQIERTPDAIHPAAVPHVTTALRQIETLIPSSAPRCIYLARCLAHATQASEPASVRDPQPDRDRAGWSRFDVSRVLQDL